MRTVAVVLIPLLLAAGCAREEPPADVVRPVQLVRASTATAASMAVFAGEVKPRHEADLAFRIGGKIVERKVDVGAAVRRGQLLARLDPSDVALQAQGAEAAAAAARTEATFARAEYERFESLNRQKFVSASALDQKRNAMNAADARLEQAQAALAVSRNQAGYAALVAPEDGVITAVTAEAGQVVASGQAVMRLARTGEREIAIAVPEHRVGEIRAARELGVVLWADPKKLYGARVREISPSVDPVTRTFAVRVAVPEADATLGLGMTANVVVGGAGTAGATLLPLSSIYHTPDGKPAVWIYDPREQKVDLRAVTLGAYREDGVLVASGVRDGEWVVAAGANKLKPGQRVRPYEEPGKPLPPGPAQAALPSTTAAR
jgi:RND family efflux transporter MFP subunit